ncbi:MAG: zf-TFIIB domain-containing protein, partial [Vicinamibacterales bacterium]
MELMGARRYYFCRHCGSFHFPEPVDEGVRVAAGAPHGAPCAICRKPMTRALVDDVHEAEYCRNCRGVLLRRRDFAAIVQRRRAWASSPPVPPEPLDRRALER